MPQFDSGAAEQIGRFSEGLLLRLLQKLLADWDASIAGVQDGPLRGPIRMTATQDFGRTEVAPLIDRFLDLHPAVQIALHLSDGVVDLVEQDIDLALRNGPLADSAL